MLLLGNTIFYRKLLSYLLLSYLSPRKMYMNCLDVMYSFLMMLADNIPAVVYAFDGCYIFIR